MGGVGHMVRKARAIGFLPVSHGLSKNFAEHTGINHARNIQTHSDSIEGSAVIYLTALWLFLQIIQYFYRRVQSHKLRLKCSLLAFSFSMVFVALTSLTL